MSSSCRGRATHGASTNRNPRASPSSRSIASGVYLLRNVRFRTVLEIYNGAWNDSTIRALNSDPANANPDDHVNQRVVVFPNAVYPEAVNIFSLRAGAYVAYTQSAQHSLVRIWEYIGIASNWLKLSVDPTAVRGRSTCAQNLECLWVPELVSGLRDGNPVYRFRPFNDRSRLLAVSSTTVLASSDNSSDGDHCQHWVLEKTDLDTNKTADWMRQVSPQNTKFSMMSIPGTHQSLALRALFISDNPRCQNRGPYLQLCDGIRLMDLRLDLYSYRAADSRGNFRAEKQYLIARHGTRPVFSAWEGYSFSAVVQSLACFLSHHKGETVFVNARIETSGAGNPGEWVRAFYEELEPYASYFFYVSDSKTFADLSLDDVRGRAIIFCDSLGGANCPLDDTGHYKTPVNNVDLFFRSNANVEVSTTIAPVGPINKAHWEAHGNRLSINLAAANANRDSSHVFRTGLNSSGFPGISGAPWGTMYNPIDFFNWLKDVWIPKETDGNAHPKGARMGVITFDFYEHALNFVKFIIERNPGVSL